MNQKICVVDIDGVLNYYPKTFIDFVNNKLKTDYKHLDNLKNSLPYSMYKNLKLEYRTSGYKETLEPREYAGKFLKRLRKNNYYIILLSARPIDEVNSLIMQTTNWLKNKDLIYDYLIFGKNKHLDIIQKFKDIDFVVEDNRAIANNIAEQGYKVFLINNEYNYGTINSLIKRVDTLDDINIIYDIWRK